MTFFDHDLYLFQTALGKSGAGRQLDRRFQPKFGFPFSGNDMDMHPGFLTGKEKVTAAVLLENGRTHRPPVSSRWRARVSGGT